VASLFTGAKWGALTPGSSANLTWSFAQGAGTLVSFDGAISASPLQDAVRLAFDLWASVAHVTFQEVGDMITSNIRLGWDGIDGIGGTLAVAHWQYAGTQTQHAEIAFDRAENWSAPAASGTDFFAVAVHEIGHVLGLAHSEASASIMYPFIQVNYAGLSTLDTQAIQQLYGASTLGGRVLVGSAVSESLVGSSGNDTISGGQGSHLLIGAGGADKILLTVLTGQAATVFGGGAASDPGDGADTISVDGGGSALLYGNGGDDQIVYTGTGAATVFGGLGADRIEVTNHAGNMVYGGTIDADSIIIRGDGNNLIFGGSAISDSLDGDDRITVIGNGANTIYGNAGSDIISVGGTGQNLVYGGLGDDRIETGSGADRLMAGPGANVLTGGRGGDVFVYTAGASDIITDFNKVEGDRLDLGGLNYVVGTAADGSAAISLGGGVIILHGLTAADVSTGYFVG
jgi:Ca2+-binding RTX toxin-like protein